MSDEQPPDAGVADDPLPDDPLTHDNTATSAEDSSSGNNLTGLARWWATPLNRVLAVTAAVLVVVAALVGALRGGTDPVADDVADDPTPAGSESDAIGGTTAITLPPPEPSGPIPVDIWTPYWTLADHLTDPARLATQLSGVREASPFWFAAPNTASDPTADVVVDRYADPSRAADFIAAINESSAVMVPSILDLLPAGTMAGILADDDLRGAHIDAIMRFADAYDVDGIDIDYEQFAFADDRSTWPTTAENWVVFLTELDAALAADDRTLSVSIPAVYDPATTGGDRGYWVYEHGTIAGIVDNVRIMAYDYSTSSPGPIAPLDWVRTAAAGVMSEVPPAYRDRIVLGIPAYGYNWVVSTAGTCADDAPARTSVNAATIDDLIERRGGVAAYDPLSAEWVYEYTLAVGGDDGVDAVSCLQTRRVHWVDAEGVAARVDVAREFGFGGVALWAHGYDDDEVWSALIDTASAPLEAG